jgi:hypothetical protein
MIRRDGVRGWWPKAGEQNEAALAAARRYSKGVVDFPNVIAAEKVALESQSALASTRA